MEKQKSELSQEFLEKKKLLDIKRKFDKESHKRRMKELKYIRETDLKRHSQKLERERIKSAEIRRSQERKAQYQNFKKYAPEYTR